MITTYKRKQKLYLIPVPLAENSAQNVLPTQVVETIQSLQVFFVENVRTARRFISSLRLGIKIEDLTFIELDKKTPLSETYEQLSSLEQDAGIMSEAGCPGIADPGAVAVSLAHQIGMQVVPLTGPSSIILTIMASGMSGQSFAFHGYLPIDKAQRKKSIQQLEKDALTRRQTQVFMETPFRNNPMLDAILDTCHPDTLLCIGANLTGQDEFIQTMTIAKWKKQKPDLHKIPTIFALGQP
jgi:16S rRNA (cytidine1402-2'-O)-methyltransferase